MNGRSAIRDLSDEELSAWIANKLEPRPIWTHPRKAREYLGTFYSDGKCWQVRFEHGERKDQQPRDMVNDAAMRWMLLEKLIAEHGFSWGMRKVERQVVEHMSCEGSLKEQHTEQSKLNRRAVAEAWALSNGWSNGKDK